MFYIVKNLDGPFLTEVVKENDNIVFETDDFKKAEAKLTEEFKAGMQITKRNCRPDATRKENMHGTI